MFWKIITEFLELFIPIEKMPAQVLFIAGLIYYHCFSFRLNFNYVFTNKNDFW
ncbi:hypothetical protein [Spiroplasma endosymbiont of Agriotes lineatus]|uniref:hypothetical protein n=1 Tax=Spiroplasma endosymbiont of Agriotes lineatus TaxID=3077930 RepID=UPI0030D52BEC